MLCSATLLPAVAQEKILFLNEGQWQTDNGRLSYFENGRIVSNQYFRDANGWKLGDTPNSIIQIDDNRLAIAVNWSNIIQFIDTKGKAITATEDVPNNRYMVSDGKFMAVGAAYSAISGESHFYTHTIDPAEVMRTGGKQGVSTRLPGTVASDVAGMQNPYSIYVNPYTGYIYGTDAADSTSAGRFYQWTPEGRLVGVHNTYINPGHIVALPPDGHFGGVDCVVADGEAAAADSTIYNLQGIPVTEPVPGQIYIRAGKKFVKH